MTPINTLIDNISSDSIFSFFQSKIGSFKQDDYTFPDARKDDDSFGIPEKIGEATLNRHETLMVFSCLSMKELSERSAKKKQFEIAKRVLREDFQDGAIFIFYDEAGNFRLSLIRQYYGKDQKFSNWKRFTYFVQPEKQNKTFKRQVDKCDFSSLEAIEEAFSVETLSKEFYTRLSHWYFASLNEVTFPNDLDKDQHQVNSRAMIRLITRMMFVWFMKQKKLIPEEIFDEKYLETLLDDQDATGSTYYKAILQNLFFATLNTEMGDNRKWITSSGYGVQHFYRYKRYFKDADKFMELMQNIPFLNGGLFENLDIVESANKEKGTPGNDIRIDCFSDNRRNEERLIVPDYLFFGRRKADISTFLDDKRKNEVEIEGLIDLLKRYDFTIDENSPDDVEVALDPELLGTVFENLLASYNPETQSTARKESGSFYTPRPIVDYMVKESLFYHLKGKCEIDEPKIRALIDVNETDKLKDAEKQSLVEAVTHIKILDPACGSGAFPMGALQQMVRLLNALDPDNTMYKEKLTEKLKTDLQQTIDQSNYEELKANIEEVFENRFNDPDYARKLFLIQNCLYGVDIQSIAMQISKLRFFISLLVEQQIDPEKENLGVKPLPNLETKFVAANTLIGLSRQDGVIKSARLIDLEEELAQVREKYFSARTYKTKRKYRAKDEELRTRIAQLLVNDGWATDTARQIARWNPFDQNASSDWFDPEWMFGVKRFDVVIGNPPYIQLQKALPDDSNLKYADLYKNEGYKTFARTGDIYCLFYEKGLMLAENGGLLCYITSNKWMRANYGKKLRKFLAGKNPLLLLDLGPGIFDSATVDTNILIIRDRKVNRHQLKAFPLEHKSQIETLDPSEMTLMTDLSEESWVILKPEEMAIKQKIERIGTPLKDWDINIYRGVLTGYNEAFIIDGEKRKELIAQDPKSAEIIKPILRGRDIKRYKAEFADLWLINTHNGYRNNKGIRIPRIKIKDYPAVKNHLDKYWVQIEKRYDQGDTPYNLRNCAYYEEFEKEKIVFQELTQGSSFSLDKVNKFYISNTGYLITGNSIGYIIAMLNSKFIEISFRKFYSISIGGKGIRWLAQYVEQIPIPILDKERRQPFIDLVNHILTKKEKGEDSTAEEREIDVLVYKLYELTYDEVLVVDPEFWLSEEEYEDYTVAKMAGKI